MVFFNEPPAHFVRSTDADGHRLLPPRLAEAKPAVPLKREDIRLKGMRVLPGQVARAKMDCLRYVCVGLRLIHLRKPER